MSISARAPDDGAGLQDYVEEEGEAGGRPEDEEIDDDEDEDEE
jgi:hypothetical protein